MIRKSHPEGAELLDKWAKIQEENGFDIRKDVLGWIQGETITASFTHEGVDAGILLLKVNNEELAREKVTSALHAAASLTETLAAQNPMMAMIAVRVMPSSHEKLTGFLNVQVGMNPPMLVGVADGYVIGGTSAAAVELCLATAKGAAVFRREPAGGGARSGGGPTSIR